MMGAVRPLMIRSNPRRNGKQRAGARDLAFGEHADQLPPVDGRAGFAERFQNDPQTTMRGNGDDAERLHEGFEDRLLGIVGIDDKTHGAIHAGDQEKAVDKGDVIGDEERAAGLRHMGLGRRCGVDRRYW